MKLPQRWKKLIRLIVVTQIVFCFSLMADEQVGVKIFPVKKKDSKILESDISQVVDAVEKSFCNLGFNCLDRGAGMSAMLEEVKLGQQGVLDEAFDDRSRGRALGPVGGDGRGGHQLQRQHHAHHAGPRPALPGGAAAFHRRHHAHAVFLGHVVDTDALHLWCVEAHRQPPAAGL